MPRVLVLVNDTVGEENEITRVLRVEQREREDDRRGILLGTAPASLGLDSLSLLSDFNLFCAHSLFLPKSEVLTSLNKTMSRYLEKFG